MLDVTDMPIKAGLNDLESQIATFEQADVLTDPLDVRAQVGDGLECENLGVKSLIIEQQNAIEALREMVSAQSMEIKRLRNSESLLFGRCAREAEASEKIWTELAEARALIECLKKEREKANSQAAAVQQESAKLEKQSRRLEDYAESLNVEKRTVRRLAKQLYKEFRSAHELHPLADYLKLTEFELSKIEIQLKTTPTLAPQRAKLAEFTAQMVEQRDFLKVVVEASRKESEKRAAALLAISRNDHLVPAPPAPPKVQGASTT